ncbi:hypothetical protein BBJ28_00003220 [Nothophytophthora sp. Chile5]|nr:hypothetical protein BBJ28_00003220 [Nothophytophthora sp. Chile5]
MENGAADRRIRVVFADELGRHVQRRRGFLSCWYLVPRDAKLVGDLAHALVREFDLRDRCPRGVELLLDDLPVLATQHAHIIRDDDTIVVQCPLVDVPASSSSGTSSSSASSSDEDEGGRGVKALKRERDLPSLQQANGRQYRGVAGPRGFPRAQKHVVFDEKTGEQVAVEQEADLPVDNDGEGRWMPRRSKVPSELDKYGPSSSDSRQPRAPRDQPVRSYEWSSNSTHGNGDMASSNGITPKRKGKWEERWKRPYVVVASVLDKKPEDSDGAASTADLTTMLAAYPTSSPSPSRFQVKDVLAFKTLTLCLETWQPVLSEWQCGQVQTVDSSGSTIDVSNWTLAASNEDNTAASVTFCEASGSEQRTLQTSEISELRYLDGPSFLALQKADDLPGPSEQQTPPPSASTDEELAPQPAASQ